VRFVVRSHFWSKQGKGWQWWQHSSKERVEGIEGAVDLNWVKP
jgi:lysozyme